MKKAVLLALSIMLALATVMPVTAGAVVKSDSTARLFGSKTVVRPYGATRYDTAVAAADALKKSAGISSFQNIIVASGANYPDALSGSYLAKVKNAPVLLVNKSTEDKIRRYIDKNLESGGTVYLLGGTSAVPRSFENSIKSKYNVKRLHGATRYDTNIEILKETGTKGQDILVCSGNGYADSLSASAVGRPILIVGNKLSAKQQSFLSTADIKDVYIIGGTAAVNKTVEKQMRPYGAVKRLSGATRYETSVAVAKQFFGTDLDTVVLACGWNFPDGLAGGPLAMEVGGPVILVGRGSREISTTSAYTGTKTKANKAVVLGGPSLISDATAKKHFHKHSWSYKQMKYKFGDACNSCYKDLTDYTNKYDCHDGWHTHEWCLEPEYQICTGCKQKIHSHYWVWHKPQYATGSSDVLTMGHYTCAGCFNFSTDGKNIDNSIQSSINNWVTAYDFTGKGYTLTTGHTDPKDYGLELQSISLNEAIYCLAKNETLQLAVTYTPSNTTSSKAITWSSSNTGVAKVSSSGMVTAVGNGTVTITAQSAEGHKDTCFIRVMDTNVGNVTSAKLLIDGVDVTDQNVTIIDQDDHAVTLETTPSQAVYNVSYRSGNPYAAHFNGASSKGKISVYSWQNGVTYTDPGTTIKALGNGTTIITAEIRDLNGNVKTVTTTVVVNLN